MKKVEQLFKRRRLGQVPKRQKFGLLLENRELDSQNCETDFEVKQEESDCGDENDENDENFFEDKIKKAQYSFSSSNSKKLFAQTKTKTCSVLLRPVPHEIIQRLTGKWYTTKGAAKWDHDLNYQSVHEYLKSCI